MSSLIRGYKSQIGLLVYDLPDHFGRHFFWFDMIWDL
jgi:hypothetical protein